MSMMGGNQDNFVSRSAHHYAVDCARSNNGLFTGILVMVFTIILLCAVAQVNVVSIAINTNFNLYESYGRIRI